jgi:hypothetical protein
MYSNKELELIFNNCKNLYEIGRAMEALLWVKEDGDITSNQVEYVREKSTGRMFEI